MNEIVRKKRAKIRRMWSALVDKTPAGKNYPTSEAFHSFVWDLPEECAYCHRPLKEWGAEIHLEHAVPISRGGSIWEFNNLRLSCDDCNMIKGVLREDEFLLLTHRDMTDFYLLFPSGAKPYWKKVGRKYWWKWKRRK